MKYIARAEKDFLILDTEKHEKVVQKIGKNTLEGLQMTISGIINGESVDVPINVKKCGYVNAKYPSGDVEFVLYDNLCSNIRKELITLFPEKKFFVTKNV